ncbi:hypothetical protein P2318_31755 [Myxococcaceae bacterium GXIMD 01537]
MELEQMPEAVRSRDDLVRFIHALREDLQRDPGDWENPTLERFLEALAGWCEDMNGYYKGRGERVPEQPTWKVVADMLMAASMYE